ncbi:lipopolysaccharide biosynthesis protein [Catenulispora yoronensis]
MRASVGMAAGLLLVGLSGYVFLAVTGHSSTPSDAAALSSLYFLAGLVTLGVFVGLEQETSRATSRAVARGRRLGPVARTARRHTVWLLGLTLAVLAVLAPVLVSGPLRGRWALFGALVLAAVVGAACYWVRGLLGGRQQFYGYAATLATEGLARLVPCVAVFVATGRGGAAWVYALAFAAAQGLAAAAGWWWLREGFDDRAEDVLDVEISEFESGERSAAGGLALLVTASLLTQLVANLPPLAASARLTHSDAVAAAFGQAFVLVRIPLLLTSPIQAMLLPDLTRSAARGDHAALRGRVRVALAAVAGLGVVGTAVLAVAGPWVLRVFFGTKADLSHALLAVLGVGTVFLMAAAILQPTLVALDRHRLVPIAWGSGRRCRWCWWRCRWIRCTRRRPGVSGAGGGGDGDGGRVGAGFAAGGWAAAWSADSGHIGCHIGCHVGSGIACRRIDQPIARATGQPDSEPAD